jgi:probable HAF family extracellular repeat protein
VAQAKDFLHGRVGDRGVQGRVDEDQGRDESGTQLGEGEGHDINNLGTAVLGVPVPGQGQPGPWVVAADGTRTDLGLPQGWGGDFRHEFSINAAGHVVGMQKNPTGAEGRAFIWDGRTVRYLDLGMDVPISSAHGINNAGQVVGWWSSSFSNSGGGFLWKDGTTTLLPGAAVSINNGGTVLLLGGDVWGDGAVRASVPALPLLPGSDPAMTPAVNAREINDAGQVVGWSEEMYLIDPESGHGSFDRGFVWSAAGGLVDLNAVMGLGPQSGRQFPLALPTDVNNIGQIVGYGPLGGWVLTPVPEPAAALLFAAAPALFAARRRR